MKRLLPFIGYFILIVVIFFPVLLPPEGTILFGPDITRYHYWERQLLGSALREGSIPWWNPFTMMGVPYLEHPQIPIWYLPNLLFVALPTNVAISWYIALHLFIAMAGMYCAIRAMSNVKSQMSKVAAWAAGLAFGLSAYFVARIPAGHIDIIAASSWTGWVMAAFAANFKFQISNFKLETNIQKHQYRRGIIIAGVALAIQLLAGHPMVAVFTLEAVFMVALFQSVATRSLLPLLRTGLAGLTGIALSAIQILPNVQFIASSIRTFPFPDSWAQLGTPTVGHLLEFLDPFYFYARLPDSGFGFEHVGYMGKTPIVFVIVAIVFWIFSKKNRRWEIPAFAVVGFFGIWMWLGGNAPLDLFYWVRSWLPIYSQIRIPARHVLLIVLPLSVLFGMGLSLIKSKALQMIVIAVLLFELVPFARRHLTLVPVPERAEDAELVSILTNDKGLFRFLPNFYHGEPLREVLEFNAPIARKIQSVSGYDTPPLRNMYEFLLAVNGYTFFEVLAYSESIPPFRNIQSPYLNFLNIKYILVPTIADTIKGIQSGQFVLVKENINRGWRLYENKNVLPRFFIATNMRKESSRNAVLSAIGQAALLTSLKLSPRWGSGEAGRRSGSARQGSIDPKTTIIVDGSYVDTSSFQPDCPAGYQGKVNVMSYGYGRIVLTTSNPCNAFLATSEIMYPGWTATIDGKSVPVFEGNAAFRTVYLPKGTHQIVFSYYPTIVLWAALTSIFTIIVIFLSFARPGLAKLTISIFPRYHINPHR